MDDAHDDGGVEMPDLQVEQGLNPTRVLQHHYETIELARHPFQAALAVAQLYTGLRGLERLDEQFRREWNALLDGDFLLYAESPRWRIKLRWREIWAAKATLYDLLDRRGMLWRVRGTDPHDAEEAEELSALLAAHEPRPGEWVPLWEGDDDE